MSACGGGRMSSQKQIPVSSEPQRLKQIRDFELLVLEQGAVP